MSDWVIGIDTHKYNGLMDYRKSYQSGARFVLSKCGGGYTNTGLPYTDNQWVNNVTNAPPVIPCFGSWWYFTGIDSTAISQANYCANLLIPYKSKLTLGFWLDCEEWFAGYTSYQNRDMTLRFIDTFEAKAQIPVRGIYNRQSFWDNFVAPHPRWQSLDLWSARYNSSLNSPWGDGRFIYRDWKIWKFWQDSADGNGRGIEFGAPPPPNADYDMDLDRWYSTLDNLYIYAGLISPPLTYEQKVDRLWAIHPEVHNIGEIK